jgi:hypothetical protein
VAKTRKLSRNFKVGFVVVFVVAIVIGLLAALLIPVHPNSVRILIFVGATFLVGGMFGIVGRCHWHYRIQEQQISAGPRTLTYVPARTCRVVRAIVPMSMRIRQSTLASP